MFDLFFVVVNSSTWLWFVCEYETSIVNDAISSHETKQNLDGHILAFLGRPAAHLVAQAFKVRVATLVNKRNVRYDANETIVRAKSGVGLHVVEPDFHARGEILAHQLQHCNFCVSIQLKLKIKIIMQNKTYKIFHNSLAES